MAYSEVEDLLTGNIPLPSQYDPQKFVNDAADEIDSHIGFLYATPVNVSEGGPVVRPARLLLKRLNNFLATGRLLMAADAAGENKQLHAYALKLVEDATAALMQIADGSVVLDGALPAPGLGVPTETSHRGPLIYNKDLESAVDAFYDELVPVNLFGSRVNGQVSGFESERWPGR